MKHFTKILALLLSVGMCFSFAACNDRNGYDKTKTQLFVYNFDGGFGSKWLEDKKAEFEEKYKDTSFQDGKKGVQIIIDDSSKYNGETLKSKLSTDINEVYFTESVNYYDYIAQNLILDITDIVEEDLTELGDTGSIADKMDETQRNYYKSAMSGNKYYGIPHYTAYFGITYDKALFDKEGFYFAATPDPTLGSVMGRFVNSTNTVKSAGPDGDPNTEYDNGLPATYEEFFLLCDYIEMKGIQPLNWSGKDKEIYLSELMFALYADYEGKDDFLKLFENAGEVNVIESFNGNTPVIGKKTVTADKGYEIYAQPGIYYALSFLESALSDTQYTNTNNFALTYSHKEAQRDYLRSTYGETERMIAMHIDGCFWESEATEFFAENEAKHPGEGSKEARELAFMPLPKATSEKSGAGSRITLVDYLQSLSFINANIAEWKIPLAKLFLQFVNTNDSLVDFTRTTSAFKALKYDLEIDDIENLTDFAKSIYNLKFNQRTDIVYPVSESERFIDNYSDYFAYGVFNSYLKGRTDNTPVATIKGGTSAKDYFLGIQENFKRKW